ncbi:MAG TPA: GDSL-type esterase/lipase family protein [Solirubrobacteraceae bacterium]|nr:GDSL-type esterase/lipase family protein [Solirubrobacteraceae bacterium]
MTINAHDCRQGLLAFGDSITNGGGELQWGVALQSWAQWTARSLGLPFTNYAFDGATASDVVGHQLSAHHRINALPDAHYHLGCLYIGVNDVRAVQWDPARYEHDFATALQYLRERSDRVLTVTIPLDLGRPRAGAKVPEANAIIERQAASFNALVLDLRDLAGRGVMMADHVHPTALGQIAIAERAVDALAADGLQAAASPRAMVTPQISRRGRISGELRYARRVVKRELGTRLRAARSPR